MWADNSVFYQIYPLGLCGSPKENDGVTVNRIGRVIEWIPHLKRLNVSAVYFSPVFQSDRHGYDTRDYMQIDCRLGTNDDFANVCRELKDNGIRVVVDGVFNHVGRGFWVFCDVLKNKESSRYRDWFCINFSGNSCYNDGFYYEGWEGHYELVKLNLYNEEVVEYLLSCIRYWIDEFDIDGLRLDVAYCLPECFIRRVRSFCDSIGRDFFLVGEVLFGDYKRIMAEDKLHSVTNYECYKGLYSSFNDNNLFEIDYALNRQFADTPYSMYKGAKMLAFVDNHDVTRLASIIKNTEHLPLVYGLLFGMPGIPCLYYGSEWGICGEKGKDSDDALRPNITTPLWNNLTELISRLAGFHTECKALYCGGYKTILITNRQLIFERSCGEERIWVSINIDSEGYTADVSKYGNVTAVDMLTDREVLLDDGKYDMLPYSLAYLRIS